MNLGKLSSDFCIICGRGKSVHAISNHIFTPKFQGYHQGDPCIYCGIPHDKVPVGDCTGKIVDTTE